MELLDFNDNDLTTMGGMVGALNTYEESPRLNPARVRPFVWAILMLRAGVTAYEVVSSIAPHAHGDDLRCWVDDGEDEEASDLERAVFATLSKMVADGFLRVSEKNEDLYVLNSNNAATGKAINVASALDGQLPDHMLAELGRSHCATFHP